MSDQQEKRQPKKLGFFRWIVCRIFSNHEWTTDLEQRGGKPIPGLKTPQEVKRAIINDSKIYCKHCGTESKLNDKLEDL